MSRLRKLALIPSAILLLIMHARGAVVGPSGYTNSFDTHPSAADWATRSRPGSSSDVYDMNADVNAFITANGVTNRTIAAEYNPTNATWSSNEFYLEMHPSGTRYIALMSKLVNDSGTNATEICISYLFTATVFLANVFEDPDKGTRVYFSLTGQTNSWTNLVTLNVTNVGRMNKGTNITVNWTNGAHLYLLWVDDNGYAGAGPGEFTSQIDNFSVAVAAGNPVPQMIRLTGAERLSASEFRMSFNANPPLAYVIEGSSNLTSWTAVYTNVHTNTAFGFAITFTDTNATADRFFYRVKRLSD